MRKLRIELDSFWSPPYTNIISCEVEYTGGELRMGNISCQTCNQLVTDYDSSFLVGFGMRPAPNSIGVCTVAIVVLVVCVVFV